MQRKGVTAIRGMNEHYENEFPDYRAGGLKDDTANAKTRKRPAAQAKNERQVETRDEELQDANLPGAFQTENLYLVAEASTILTLTRKFVEMR